MKIFPLGACGGAAPPSVNLGPLIYRKLLELESLNYTHVYVGSSSLFRYENFSARGVRGAQRP